MARPGLTGHRKFKRLVRALGSAILARGALELLWDSCYEYGDAYVGTSEDIEATVGWTGEPGALTNALLNCGKPEGYGFIEPVNGADGCFQVHDLWHHAPDYVGKRHKRELARQQRVAPTSKRRRTAPNGGQRRPSLDWQNGVDVTPAPSPAPSPAPEDKSVSSEVARDSEPTPDVLVIFPIVGKGGPEWSLTADRVETWTTLYPTVDVMAEMLKALAWIDANPTKRKTARGMPRFLVSWLSRATDRGGPRAIPDRGGGEYTQRELEAARNWKRAVRECPHQPECENAGVCMRRFIRERLRLAEPA